MLNKKIIVACTVVFFLLVSGFGLTYYTRDTQQQISQSEADENTATKAENLELKISNEVAKDVVEEQKEADQAAETESAEVKDSEEAAQSKKTESIEQKRPSLTTASRGGGLAPRSVNTESKQISKASEAPKQEQKPAPAQPTKPAASNTVNGWSQEDYYWLAKMIHAESRGEPYEGQVAVGAVILRRVHHPDFPNTVYGVIFDKWDGKYYQFSPVADGSINLEPNESAYKAARDAMNGSDPSGGALYFYNPAKSTSKWILTRPVIKTIGEHTFAK